MLNIHRLFTCCPIFTYCIFTNIVFRRWGCHQNAGKHYVYNGLLLWRSHCTIPHQFRGIGRPSPSHTNCPSKLAAKLTLFTGHSKDSPFQVQINFLSIITPPEEAYRCNSKRQNASRILPFSSVCSSLKLVRKTQKTNKQKTPPFFVVRFWYIYLNSSLITLYSKLYSKRKTTLFKDDY